MGNEESREVVDDSEPPQTLESRTIESVAKYITEKNIRRIVVMVMTAQPAILPPIEPRS